MQNTFTHSVALAAIAAASLALFGAAIVLAAGALVDVPPNQAKAVSLLAAPTLALSKLLPGLVLGWFTRRHPLLVGAAAGVLGVLASQPFASLALGPWALGGEAIATGMTVAVAALAGRTLRRHIRPAARSVSAA